MMHCRWLMILTDFRIFSLLNLHVQVLPPNTEKIYGSRISDIPGYWSLYYFNSLNPFPNLTFGLSAAGLLTLPFRWKLAVNFVEFREFQQG